MQPYEAINAEIRQAFLERQGEDPERFRQPLNLGWSNWGFGTEALEDSCVRLQSNGIQWIEVHGNRYGEDLGYRGSVVSEVLRDHGLRCSGVCGMYGCDNELASDRGVVRQAAVDYTRRQLDLCADLGGSYLLVVPGAVGRPRAMDSSERFRSVETLRLLGDDFLAHGVQAAIEPIRAEEVSFCHTIAEAKAYIADVGHRGIGHINGDVYHMQAGETHIGQAILSAGDQLVNLHLADSNRLALGLGALDVDTMIMALYLMGYNQPGRFVTPEPLGPGGDPYPAMFGQTPSEELDALVAQTVNHFRARERAILRQEEVWAVA